MPWRCPSGRLALLASSVLVGALAVLTPRVARADEPAAPLDTVYLRDGGMVRGRVLEILPGDHVTVTLETGETRRVPWALVDRAIVASAATIPPLAARPAEPSPVVQALPPLPPPSAPPPTILVLPSAPAAPPPRASGPTVRVHLVTTGSSLFRTPAGTTDVTRVCYAPCDVEVPLEDGYRLNVQGSTSKEFRLRGAPGSVVDLAVDPPSLGGIVGGGVLALGGGAAVYLTAIFADVNALTGTGGTTGEVVALVAGVGAMIVGGVVVANSLSTDVTQASGGERATATRVSPREPMWHLAERGPLDAPAGASVTLPLFAGRF